MQLINKRKKMMAKTTNIDADALALIEYGAEREKEVQALKLQLENLHTDKEKQYRDMQNQLEEEKAKHRGEKDKILSKEYCVKRTHFGWPSTVFVDAFAPMTDTYKEQKDKIDKLEDKIAELEKTSESLQIRNTRLLSASIALLIIACAVIFPLLIQWLR
jgi:DNA repair exonuclease SbcCD ATPase subunit